ncbi:MAG TPA: flagellar hook assembly protein FlgD [Steroidobacteraceae bacterium]|jgi:flagellar basal-body rod modification protein FlgD|nr:flagellar hook assembly protein FlgD [Steroidobacteraceae bacterium]
MTVNNVNNTQSNSTPNATSNIAANSMSSLGINDFIQLMTTQLKYQDPTQPQDSTQFVAQLAQFSTVSGVQQMNSSISSLLNQLKSSQAVSATSLVGHTVLVQGKSIPMMAGDKVVGAIDTPSKASNVNVTVTDGSGQVVKHLSVPAQAGLSYFTWDGTDDAGNAVKDGKYEFTAAATVAGKPVAATTLLANRIDSVTIDPSTNDLQLNTDSLGTVTLADVRQVF